MIIDIFLVAVGSVGAAGVIAIVCHAFGYEAGRNKALDDRLYPDADAPYVHFARGMDRFEDRLDFLHRAIKRLHEIESAKAEKAKDQGARDEPDQPEGNGLD
ncbi:MULTISPECIES: hypothetical protein [unclassified Pseudomonas]|uniref:hypothetical protein n=1 Tax=unclassified Pseudomonas TaxID=196821 RepID=UPI0024491026|nr:MULTISPECIES: hypothetical protein [unclassified Pseudomonas]MDG9928283.1 hypothetical protein [Pseudomonas sp. GD04042]MDH0481153.1 hypothetical protein [Pseudomonas sp. GD04015]MDH0604489.1 hypothetical protein [Pseudomonas sp. GD03869]